VIGGRPGVPWKQPARRSVATNRPSRNLPALLDHLVTALKLEQNDEWAVSRRYMSLQSLADLSDDPIFRLSAVPA
jgi:hypothetical protein